MLNYRYKAVPGYFLHDDPASFPIDAVPPRFGLNDDSNNRWKNFFEGIRKLNNLETADKARYKFFLLSRHGEGYHNVAEVKYRPEWDSYWSTLNGDGEIVWGPDPELTPIGIEQARTVHDTWVSEAASGLLPPPDIRYCSPFTRALHTACISFEGTFEKYPSGIIVKEDCREMNGVHTCDMRRTVSYIASRFPRVEIEANMTEDDQLWSATVRETRDEVAARAKIVLDEIFESCDASDIFISITAHSGFMKGFLTAIGREAASVILPIGGVLPVVVKAEYDD